MNCDRIICPSCGGKGEVMVHMSILGSRGSMWPCFRCKGEKYISSRMPVWMAEGERLRDLRRAANRSLKEEAARLGIPVPDLSRMEHGRLKPYSLDSDDIAKQ